MCYGNGKASFLNIMEGVTQGDPLSIVACGEEGVSVKFTAIVSLAREFGEIPKIDRDGMETGPVICTYSNLNM